VTRQLKEPEAVLALLINGEKALYST